MVCLAPLPPSDQDKVRLRLAGRLHRGQQPNFGNGCTAMWFKAADVTHVQMIELVRNSPPASQISD